MSQLKIKNGNNWESIPAGGIGVPSGGTTGQVLKKSSNTDYATEWENPSNFLEWKLHNTVSGSTHTTLPSGTFNELLVIVNSGHTDNAYDFTYSILIPYDDITRTTTRTTGRRYYSGYNAGDGANFVELVHKNGEMYINTIKTANGNSISNTVTRYYYR